MACLKSRSNWPSYLSYLETLGHFCITPPVTKKEVEKRQKRQLSGVSNSGFCDFSKKERERVLVLHLPVFYRILVTFGGIQWIVVVAS